MSNRNVWKTVNWMDRQEIQNILESHGFAVYDRDTDDELRECLVRNVDDGTIEIDLM